MFTSEKVINLKKLQNSFPDRLFVMAHVRSTDHTVDRLSPQEDYYYSAAGKEGWSTRVASWHESHFLTLLLPSYCGPPGVPLFYPRETNFFPQSTLLPNQVLIGIPLGSPGLRFCIDLRKGRDLPQIYLHCPGMTILRVGDQVKDVPSGAMLSTCSQCPIRNTVVFRPSQVNLNT